MLTADQRMKIEENRKRALEKRAERQSSKKSTVCRLSSYPPSNSEHNAVVVFPTFNPNDHSASNSPKKYIAPDFKASTTVSNLIKKPVCSLTKQSVVINGTFELISRKRFKVDMPYHRETIELFKTIPSRMYDAKDKRWNFSISDHDLLVKSLKPLQPSVMVSPLTTTVVNIFKKVITDKVEFPESDLSTLDPKIQEALLPFQKEGVFYSLSREGRVLIADDMGLGKTIQAIAVSSYYMKEWPLLVVVPSSVKYTWADAFYTWMPSFPRSEVNVMNTGRDNVFEGSVIITSYDLLGRKTSDFKNREFKVVIMDECHFLKSHKSARTKAAQEITKKCKRIILLSGTPALSRPMELYTQISMIRPHLFRNYQEFGLRYCNGRLMPWGWDFSGSCNMHELRLVLEETMLIRRLKSDVMSQLPPKRRQVILLDPANIKGNKKQMNKFSNEMESNELGSVEKRGILMQYFHETGIAKIPAINNYIVDLIEANHKFLCFAHHKNVMKEVCQLLESRNIEFICIDGATPSDTRKVLCDQFQRNEDCRVAVLSITAANAGISLTAAHLVLFVELFWNPGILTQAEDRAHRIGQQDSVVVQYLVAKGTADDFIWPLVQKKLDTLSKAGLSKDNFKDADTCTFDMPNSSQKTIDKFFETIEHDEYWKDFEPECISSLDEEPIEKLGRF